MEVGAGNHEMVSRTLHIQAAKVVAAHAASVGDALLGVPLLCSAGEIPLGAEHCCVRPLRQSIALWVPRLLRCACQRCVSPTG